MTQITTNENDYQQEQLTDHFIQENLTLQHNYPNVVPLMSSKEKLKCRKTPVVLQYYEPNRHVLPEYCYHHILFMYYPIRRKDELKGRNPPTYSQKFNESEVAAAVNRNRRLIEPHTELVDEAYEGMQNIELNHEDSSAEHHNEHESFLGQENFDD